MKAFILALLLAFGSAAKADTIINLAFYETTFLYGSNGSAGDESAGATMGWATPDDILSVVWDRSGDELEALETNVSLENTIFGQGCGYLVGGASNCSGPNDTISGPYVSTILWAGDWGSILLGFGSSSPIIINATYSQQTLLESEPATWMMLLFGLLLLTGVRYSPAFRFLSR